MERHQQPCCLLGTESPVPSNHTWDGDPGTSLQLHATTPEDSDAPAPRPSPVPLRGGGVEEEEVRDLRCPMHSKHTAVETEAGRQMMHRVCLMLRCGARTLTSGGGASAFRSSWAAEARPGSHRQSFTKKVSRPAPRSHSPAPAEIPAPAACGSAPRPARAPEAAAVPSPRGPSASA